MIRRQITALAVFSLVFTTGLTAVAQNFGMSGSRGMGSSGMGSSSFGSGMGGFGNSGFGGSGFGGSGFGNSGFGGSGFGNSGFGGSGFGNSGFGNSGFGNSMSYGGGQNFVGRDASDMQATFGQMGRAGTQFFNNMNRNMNRNSSRRSNKQTTQNSPQPVRVAVKVAFTPPRPTADQAAAVIRTRLTKILTERKMSPATFNMEGDTAVVSGVAASEGERDLISQLLAIEPGIGNVRNEMTIGVPADATNGIAPSPGS